MKLPFFVGEKKKAKHNQFHMVRRNTYHVGLLWELILK